MPSNEEPAADLRHLRAAIRLSQEARQRGDHPFGALLVGPDGEVLSQAMNTVNTTVRVLRSPAQARPPPTP